MSDVHIELAQNPEDRKAFAAFPWKVYAGDPHWVPPMFHERLSFLDVGKNPFFEHSRAAYFVARRGGEPVGTIAAISNTRYNEFHQTDVGWFGFFEVLPDPAAAGALLTAAEDWLRQAGHKAALGPAQFSTNDEVGLLIDGFDDAPRVMMTYNPPRYREYLETAGYTKAQDLFAYVADVREFQRNTPPKLERVVNKVLERGKFTVRKVDMKHFDQELEHVKRLYNQSWEQNWGFVPMTPAEFDKLAESLKPILDPDLVIVVEHDGVPVGFGLSLPDLNQPLRKAYPRPGTPEWVTLVRLLWHWKVRRSVTWLRVLALGVMPEFRGQGVDALLYLTTARNAAAKGIAFGEMSWILESNDMMNRAIRFLGGKVYKTYRVYGKEL